MGANISADRSNYIIRLDDFQGFLIPALIDEAYITSGLSAHRAGRGAGRQQLVLALVLHPGFPSNSPKVFDDDINIIPPPTIISDTTCALVKLS
jgi:hypothetical protein